MKAECVSLKRIKVKTYIKMLYLPFYCVVDNWYLQCEDFWDVVSCSIVENYQHFGEFVLNIEALFAFNILVSFYCNTRLHIPGE
jgi:hypothetical protein